MSEFKKYRRKQIAELREVTQEHIDLFKLKHALVLPGGIQVSISPEDINHGSPKLGDMIARNPKNYKDQWLVAEQYFKDNFEAIQ
ncbi:hypothetical protein [Croceimicrobium hydrocarbonivorans]|uniref:Uncharacterized protein n=1 Tax=Croceimicrobium hydrocarbonivorans TaxID=2761580 RepID=A0A7H0VBC3_9FLAO|nr:hypothetical protein [Croceimicrobium hydrocarbonivorans]QNR23021.1 hypothetical protein H4K34_11585 [Croceimicrobium hydrocarbonivorans]